MTVGLQLGKRWARIRKIFHGWYHMAEKEAAPKAEDFKEPNKATVHANPILTILLFLNTGLIGAVGYFQYTMHQKEAAETSIQDIVRAEIKEAKAAENEVTGEAKEDEGKLFPLEGFTANLAQGDGPRRYVRLEAVLKFSRDSNEEEFKARKPQIRDSIISILNSKRPADLLKVEGKQYLKEEIKAAINTFLVEGSIVDIYYVGFQIN